MCISIFIDCELEHFIDPPASLPPGALANPLGTGWWVDGDVSHLIEWVAADEGLGTGPRRAEIEFPNWNLRRLTQSSRLLVVKCVAGADGDLDLRIIAVFRVTGLQVSGDDVEWHTRLLRRVQEQCQEPGEWLPVVSLATEVEIEAVK